MKPSVGRIVHYVFTMAECCAAIIIAVRHDTGVDTDIDLMVFTERGLSVRTDIGFHDPKEKFENTWHWPERVDD